MKKRILLIQPENEEINKFRKKQFNNFIQITMPYLAAFINEEMYDITLIDEYNQKIPYDIHFDLVAMTVNTPNSSHCYRISRKFREKGASVVMGGPHATLMTEEVKSNCDYILIGETENIWVEFLNDFYQGNAVPLYTPTEIPELKNLPVPRWDMVKHRSRIMKGAVIATRGCPYNCRYCNLKQIYFNCYRTRPLDEVVNEIRLIKSRFFVFWDDNLFANKDYAKSLFKKLKPLKKKWAAQVTLLDCVDDELLCLARESGCLYLFIGLESFSEKSLKDAGKEINKIFQYSTIIENIHAHKIMVQAGIIFGFDNDTKTVFDDTLKACEELGIDGATVSILTPLPKTPIYEQMKSDNRLLTKDWSFYNGKTEVVFMPENMTPNELFEGYMYFRHRFYSFASFIKRMRVSKTHLFYNLVMNLGYWLAMKN